VPDGKIRYGVWKVRLTATKVSQRERRNGVRFDAWIERTLPISNDDQDQLRSRFVDYDPDTAITLTTPATARKAIAVASFNNRRQDNPISVFSSRGPTRDQREKPEVAAPGGEAMRGEEISSTNAGAGLSDGGTTRPARVGMHGTSQSAPHVTGIVARLLGRQRFLYAEEISEILVKSARQTGRRKGWNRERGFGNVDAAGAMRFLEEKLDPQ
jgi:subtilisin family serine protease